MAPAPGPPAPSPTGTTARPIAAWDSNTAVFGGTAGTVSIDSVAPPSATGIIFNTTGYTLAAGGGTVTVTGGYLGNYSQSAIGTPTIGVLPGLSATINAPIGGSAVVYVGQGNTTAYSGTLILGGANTFTNGIDITGGATVVASSDANFGTAPGTASINAPQNIYMDGGTLHIPVGFALASTREIYMVDAGVVVNGIQHIGGGGTIIVDSGTFSMAGEFAPASNPCTITGAGNMKVTGSFQSYTSLTKNGTGTLTINGGSGGVTGPITVNAGILSIEQSNSLGNAPSGAPFYGQPLTLNGGELDDTRGAGTFQFINGTRAIVIGPNGGTVNFTGTASGILETYTAGASGPSGMTIPTGGLQGSGPFTLIGNATGATTTLAFNATASLEVPNTNTGSTTINNATIQIGSAGSNATNILSPNSAIILSNGGILNIAGYSQVIASLSDGAGAFGAVKIGNATGGVLTLGGDNTSTTFSGVISGTASTAGGGLTKVGTGTFTLASPTGSTYGSSASITTVSNGTLSVTNTSGSATGNGTVFALGSGGSGGAGGSSAVGTGGSLGGTGTLRIGHHRIDHGTSRAALFIQARRGHRRHADVRSMSWQPFGRYVFAYNADQRRHWRRRQQPH